MPLRDKVKRAFHIPNNPSRPATNGNGVKIEYYKRHETPRSKFRGPFDREHQERLAAWNFPTAQEDRPRSPDLSLSPCATLPVPQPAQIQTLDDSDDSRESDEPSDFFDSSPTIIHDEYVNTGSQSSTVVDSNASILALPLDPYRDDSISLVKESMRYSSPVIKKLPMPQSKGMPFAPEDLSRALHAVLV